MTRDTAVLVTGAGGLLGRRICTALSEDHDVIGLDVDPAGDGVETHDWVRCDLTDDDSVNDAVSRVREIAGDRLASVVHLAAYFDFSGAPSPLYQDLTVEGTRRVLRAARELDADQFVFASSVLAMRPAEDGTQLDESSPERAEWDYPQSKLEAERVLREERGDLPVVVLRIAGCYDDGCHSIPLAQQIRRIHEKQFKSHFFPGDRSRGQSFVHVDDVASCVRSTVAHRADLEGHELFLVAEPTWLSYAELQDRVGKLRHGKEWTTLRVPGPVARLGAWVEDKLGDSDAFIKPWMIDLADAHYPVDISKARERLGWEPVHRLPDELPGMVEALRDDPDAWYRENGLAEAVEATR